MARSHRMAFDSVCFTSGKYLHVHDETTLRGVGGALRSGPGEGVSLTPAVREERIGAYSKQKRAYFVNLVSPKLFSSDQVRSFADFQRLAPGPLGQPEQSEVQALAQDLQAYGVYLRYVSKDLRTATLIGTVPALVNAPAAPINDGNFLTVKDAAGDRAFGAAVVAFGGIVVVAGGILKSPEVVIAGLVVGTRRLVGSGESIGWRCPSPFSQAKQRQYRYPERSGRPGKSEW